MAGLMIIILLLVLVGAVITLAFKNDKLNKENDGLREKYFDCMADYNRLNLSYGVALNDIAKLKGKQLMAYGPPNKTKKKRPRPGRKTVQMRREKQVIQEQIHNQMMSIWPED